MIKDILKIIGEFSGNDLEDFKYICDSCNKKFNDFDMCCIIYYHDKVSSKPYNDFIDFYQKNRIFHYDYICSKCYKEYYKYENMIFFCAMLLDLNSFEDIYYDIIKYKQEYHSHNCIMDNIAIEQNNTGNWYKTLIIKYDFIDNVIIEDCILYESTVPIIKYFQNNRDDLFQYYDIDKCIELLK